MLVSNSYIERFFSLGGRIRPIWLKKKWFSLFHTVHSLGMRTYRIISEVRLPVFVASGVGKASREPLSLLYIGKGHVPYFLFHKLFDTEPVLKKKDAIWIWDCSKIKQKSISEVEGIVVSCDRFLQRFLHNRGWFVLPHWIGMWSDSSKDLAVLLDELPRSAKYDVKKVKKSGFTFAITSDINKIRYFYDELYLPTITSNVEKDEAYIADFLFFLLRCYKGYELMMISEGGKEVAGVFFVQKGDMMMLEYAGVLKGDTALIKKGVFASIYYFAIGLAKQRNVKKIDFGGVRSFSNDGLFLYKKKWGMIVEPYFLVTDIAGFTMVRKNDDFIRFLIDNPFIGMDKKGTFVWYVFSRKALESNEKRVYEKKLNIAGVEKVCFVEI